MNENFGKASEWTLTYERFTFTCLPRWPISFTFYLSGNTSCWTGFFFKCVSCFPPPQVVCQKQDVSLVWGIADAGSGEGEVNAAFTCEFTCDLDLSKQSRTFTYNCHLSDFQVSVGF